MLKSFVFVAAIFGTLITWTTASVTNTVPSCYSNCLSSAAQAVGCASDNVDCIKASDTFIDLARSCLEENKCTELSPGTSTDTAAVEHAISILSALDLIDKATIPSNIDFTPYHSTRDLTGLSRILPIEKRQTLCVPANPLVCLLGGQAACAANCLACHSGLGSEGCTLCLLGGTCTGALIQMCECTEPCLPLCLL
ncbi:hypothetical protein CC2G_005032 [Coprinopsis cinerea AmutBmut pab1-1]|nr:hypothetical protein CC2G_005032 [Coprinopsis cinerea AmutBmut pab1-1]